ncbi:MAG TPA: glycosyltransferase, partial [Nitrososphaeraceae archaeon]|nr:glycosyltransferase [Nitrososphaeraceae archaeon]
MLTMLNEQVFSNNTQILTEGISSLFLILELYLLRSKNPKHWYLAGLALALTFVSRYPIGIQAIVILIAEGIFTNNGKLVKRAIIGAMPIVLLGIMIIFVKTGTFQMSIEQDTALALFPSLFYLTNSIQIWGPAIVFVPIALFFRRTYQNRQNYVFVLWFIIAMLFWSMSAANYNYRFSVQFTPAVYYLAVLGIQNILWYFKNGITKKDIVFYPIPSTVTDPKIKITSDHGQRFQTDGKLHVTADGWIIRIIAILVLLGVIAYNSILSMRTLDPFIAYSTIIPVYVLAVTIVGWFFYKNPIIKGTRETTELVSVIMPLYNQRHIITDVIDSIYQSKYKNLQVIIVDDGSTDGSGDVADKAMKKYPNLMVIHKRNEGKRKAIVDGFYASTGDYIVLIDSDSIIHENAFPELLRGLNSDDNIGAAVGCVKVWNSDKNFVTKCQDAWYDFAFNVTKSAESHFNNVLCCTGCLAAYRRDVIKSFIDKHWRSHLDKRSNKRTKGMKVSDRLKKEMASYDDSEDRALTAGVLLENKVVYVASAVAYTEVPTKFHQWAKQQLRWQKGYLRAALFLSTFFWTKHPVMSFMFYTELLSTFSTPLILVLILIYFPFGAHNLSVTFAFLTGTAVTGFLSGLDYKLRDPTSKNWKYKIIMNLLLAFVFSWLILGAIYSYRRNTWLTR